jgi:hypothetical protein
MKGDRVSRSKDRIAPMPHRLKARDFLPNDPLYAHVIEVRESLHSL